MLDFTLLQHLEILLDQRSVSKAAVHVGLSQPAMSRILARLRDQFGDPLLTRGHNQMILTPRAETLLPSLREWLRDGENLLKNPVFMPDNACRSFRVASTDYGMLTVVSPTAARLETEAPGCSLELAPLSASSVHQLDTGELDFLISGISFHGQGLKSRWIFSDSYLGLACEDHPILRAAPTRDDLVQSPHIVTNIGEGLSDWIIEALPEIAHNHSIIRSNSFSLTPYLVAGSKEAVAILPAQAARRFAELHGLRTFSLPLDLKPLDYYLIWHQRSDLDAGLQWLLTLLASPFDDRPATPQAVRPRIA